MSDDIMKIPDDVIEEHIRMGEALKQLENYEPFKILLKDGYMGKKALDAVSLLAVDAVANDEKEIARVHADLNGISNLMYFLHQTRVFYEGALNTRKENDDEEYSEGDPL